MSYISTGIDSLDRDLQGGIPSGYILSIIAPPASNSERFLHQFVAENEDRQAVYFTTEQSEPFLRDSFDKLNILDQPPQIVDLTSEREPLDKISGYIQKMPEESIVIIDSIDRLEDEDSDRYQDFINELQRYLSNSDSTAILFGTSSGQHSPPKGRPVSMKLSDAIFEIDQLKQSEDLISYLSITKFRGIKGVDERVRIQMESDSVGIDTSRDIA